MAPDTEREMLEKINEIHGYIFGVSGRPGAMENVQTALDSHDKRIETLESWRWYITGGVVVLLGIAKLVWGH
jgi:hypothetical protein